MADVMEIQKGYKQTEVGMIPIDWEISSVGDAFEICNYLRCPISQDVRKCMKGEYPYYGPTKIQDHIDEYRIEGEYALIGEDGDHFFKWADIPMTQLADGKFNVNNHAHLIKGKIGFSLTKWFYYYFKNKNITFFLTRQGAGRFKLTKTVLSAIPCALPSTISEQTAIAIVLTDADTLITQLEKLIAKKRDIKQGAMQELLKPKEGRIKKKFGELFDLNRSKLTIKKEKLVTFLGMEDVSANGKIINQNLLLFSQVKKGLSFFKKNDVLVAKITPCFENGKGACLDTLKTENGFGSTEFYVLRPNDHSVPRFIFYHTQAQRFRNQLESEMVGTAGQKRVSGKSIINYQISIPPIQEQKEIARILSDMDAEIEALEKKLEKYKRIKQGMMQVLLTGRIRLV
jgi:type I restriction enzyme S subunit